jgi:cell wall-associated NlpC family hydrolase
MFFNSERASLCAALSLTLLFHGPGLMFAQTPQIEQKQAEADQVKSQIGQINDQLEGIVEQYNIVDIKLSETERAINETRNKLQIAQLNLERSQQVLSSRLKSIYKYGQPDFIVVLMSTRSFSDFLIRLDWLIRIGKQDAKILKEVRENKISVEKLENKLDLERQAQITLKKELEAKRQEIEAQLEERKNFLASVETEIAQLIQEEEERQRRNQEEYARQLQLQQQMRMGYQSNSTSTTGTVDAVVGIALQFLNIPYHWAGEGPGKCPTGVHQICFDCSGFTMYVFHQIGIDLPHSAAQQYTFGVPVEKSHLQPADLVFFGSSGVSHVGIYIGEGNFIHASSNGDIVKIQTLESHENYIGARRIL